MAIFFECFTLVGVCLVFGVILYVAYRMVKGVGDVRDLAIIIAAVGIAVCALLASGRSAAGLSFVLLAVALYVVVVAIERWRVERSDAMRHIRSGVILALSDSLDRDEGYLAKWAEQLKIGQRQVGLSSLYFTLSDLATLARFVWRIGNWKVITTDNKQPRVLLAHYRRLEDDGEVLTIKTNVVSSRGHHYEMYGSDVISDSAIPDLDVKTADYLVLARQAADSYFTKEEIATDPVRFPKGIDTETVSCGVVADDDANERPVAQLMAWAFAWECASYNEARLEQGDVAQPANLRVESGADGGLVFIVQSREQLWILVNFAKNICEALSVRKDFQASRARQFHIAATTGIAATTDAAQA